MSDREDKFDEMFQTKLNEFKLPVSDKVFPAIQKEILAKTGAKIGLAKFFGLGKTIILFVSIAGASVGGYFIYKHFNNNKTIASVISKNMDSSSVLENTNPGNEQPLNTGEKNSNNAEQPAEALVEDKTSSTINTNEERKGVHLEQ